MTRASATGEYRADIDGLRAVAVLAVLGFHGFPGYFPGGFFGVDIFFVLSGYLITGLILTGGRETPFDIRDFYARRIRRLFPAGLTVIATVCAAGYVLLFSHEFARLARHAWASLFFVENMLLAREVGYFDVAAATKPLLHFWSLAVEEQFYLFWPLLLLPVRRRPAVAGAVIAVVLAGSLLLTLSGVWTPSARFYSPLIRAWELAAGAGLAWHVLHFGRLPGTGREHVRDAAALAALVAIAAIVLIGPRGLAHPGWITLVPVAATVTLIAAGPGALVNARLLALRPSVAVGLISYPLYLWHWPLLSFTFVVLGDRGPTMLRVLLLAASFLLAAATYRLIERPLRFRLPRTRAVGLLLGGMLTIAAALFAPLYLRPPHTDRMAEVAEEQLEGVAWRHTANDLCRKRNPKHFTAFCMQSGDRDPAVLFVGNSYANHLFPGLVQHPAMRDVSMLAFGTCELSRTFPIGIYGKDQCDEQFAMLRRFRTVELVLVANQWPMFDDSGRMSDLQPGDPGKASDYPDAATYRRALRRTFEQLGSKRVPVVIFGPKAELGYDIADCYGRPLRPPKQNCERSRAGFEREAAVTVAILKDLVREVPNLLYFDLADLFCDRSTCRYRAPDGTPWLRDNGHFSEAGSRYVAARFLDWARAQQIALPRAVPAGR